MRYYRCKCGSREQWSTDGIADCVICNKCNTTLAGGPEGHKTHAAPHQFETYYDTKTGKPFKICLKCHSRENIQEEFDAARQAKPVV